MPNSRASTLSRGVPLNLTSKNSNENSYGQTGSKHGGKEQTSKLKQTEVKPGENLICSHFLLLRSKLKGQYTDVKSGCVI